MDGGRPIGLGWMAADWSNSPNVSGYSMALGSNMIVNVQGSPDGKWYKLATIIGNPSQVTSKIMYLDLYVVQEGDEFTDRDGNVLDYVKPGNLLRLTYSRTDAYDCDPANLRFAYFPRPVAELDEETGKIQPVCPHYDALMEAMTSQPSKDIELATFGFTDASSLTKDERYDLQVSHISDIQMHTSAATPPHGDAIEFE